MCYDTYRSCNKKLKEIIQLYSHDLLGWKMSWYSVTLGISAYVDSSSGSVPDLSASSIVRTSNL